jgi:hypothetical protein
MMVESSCSIRKAIATIMGIMTGSLGGGASGGWDRSTTAGE